MHIANAFGTHPFLLNAEIIMDYIKWNNEIAKYLFKPSRKGQEIFLYLTEDDIIQAIKESAERTREKPDKVLELLASKPNIEILADFWTALRTGPVFWGDLNGASQKLLLKEGIYGKIVRPVPKHPGERAKYAWEDWERANPATNYPGVRTIIHQEGMKLSIQAPLHLLYLACFTLPFSIADSVQTRNGYYDCWNTFFGTCNLLKNGVQMPNTGLQQLGDGVWVKMWQELARWSQEDLEGERGILIARQLGSHSYVGWPRAQCLLSPSTLVKLPEFFIKNHLFPSTSVGIETIRGLLLGTSNGLDLPKSTCQELEQNSELGQAVVDIVLKVFNSWDGSSNRRERKVLSGGKVQTLDFKGITNAKFFPFLPDNINETEELAWQFRLQIKTALPEDLRLSGNGLDNEPVQPETKEWSREIPGVHIGTEPKIYKDLTNKWQVLLDLPDIVVFIPGGRFGFYQQWTPFPALEFGTRLLILCREKYGEIIKGWGIKGGVSTFKDWSDFEGLPVGFNLFWLKSLPEEVKGLPGLSISSEIKIVAEGGLNFGSRTYSEDFPPSFRLINGKDNWPLFLVYLKNHASIALIPDEKDDRLWHLPDQIDTNESFRICAEGQKEIISLPFVLNSEQLTSKYLPAARDAFGRPDINLISDLYYDGVRICGNTELVNSLRKRQSQYEFYYKPGF